jgi:hypothetical protein
MPDPFMFTEAAFLLDSSFAMPRPRPCRADRIFQTLAEMEGVDLGQLDPAVVRAAAERCKRCACRKACRRWLRTGVFHYAGDPRCPNIALLHH